MSYYSKDLLVNITLMFLIATGGIGFVVINDIAKSIINKKRLGYNLIVLLTKSGLNSGKTVSVSDENGESKARKYTFVINKNHMNNFVKKILQDGSVENNSAVRDISDMFFDVIKQCKDTDFKISAVIHKGKVISVECETPEISGNAYIISITRNETDGKLGLNINNISQNKNVMKASAECRNGNIRFLYAGNKPEITADVITDNNRAKISILEKNKFSLNFMTQKTNQSYDIEFYKDKRFIKPPYLSVYLTKNSR